MSSQNVSARCTISGESLDLKVCLAKAWQKQNKHTLAHTHTTLSKAFPPSSLLLARSACLIRSVDLVPDTGLLRPFCRREWLSKIQMQRAPEATVAILWAESSCNDKDGRARKSIAVHTRHIRASFDGKTVSQMKQGLDIIFLEKCLLAGIEV